MSQYRVVDDGMQLLIAKVLLDTSGHPISVVEFVESISGMNLSDLRSTVRAITDALDKPVIFSEDLIVT